MAKATIQLPNGTMVVVEGTPEEVKRLLEFYGGSTASTGKKPIKRSGKRTSGASSPVRSPRPSLMEVVNLIKNSDEAEQIEAQILDRISQVNRILLPLYVIHKYLDNAFGLTSGEVSQITKDLGIPVSTPNASKTLSGTASKYVIGDKVRKKGQPVHYKISRRGVNYLSDVLKGSKDGD